MIELLKHENQQYFQLFSYLKNLVIRQHRTQSEADELNRKVTENATTCFSIFRKQKQLLLNFKYFIIGLLISLCLQHGQN